MAGENSTTGPEGAKATSGEPTPEQIEAGQKADALAAYGIASTEPGASGGDPEKKEPEQKKSEAKPEGDPSKQPPTGQTGPEGKPTTPPEKKLLAGKYETPEALELGHTELQAQYSKILNEKKTREAELLKELEEAKKAKESATPPAKSGEGGDKPSPAPPSSVREIAKTNPKLAKILTTLSESLGESEANALSDFLDTALEHERSRYAALEAKLSEHDKVVSQVAAGEQERMFREVEMEFSDAHPEYKDPDIKAECDKILKEIAENGNNPKYLLELQLYAAKGRLLPQLVDKLLSKRVKELSKAEVDKMLASGLIVSGGAGPSSGGGAENDDARTVGLKAYGLEPK
ncbi:MAG: hypothetical protein AB1690_02465 [Candidatus Zixiibacteriota bacterium]